MHDWHVSDGRSFTVILPTLNEGQNIIPMLDALMGLYPAAKVLVVDDSSPDGTAEKVTAYSKQCPNVSLIRRNAEDAGLTASIVEGIALTETPYFVVMDADFQHPPEAVSEIMDAVVGGSHIAVGVRKDMKGLQFARKVSSRGAHRMASAYLRMKGKPRTRDTMSGFFGGRTDFCKKIIMKEFGRFQRRGFKALFDLLKFAPEGAEVSEVEFHFGERRGGSSKLTSQVVISIMKQCGWGGRAVAAVTTFLLLTMLGRFVAALMLGLLSTFIFLGMTGEPWTEMILFPMVISFLLAVGYVVVANELLSGRRRYVGMIRGLQIVATAFTGFILNLGLFYIVATEIPSFQVLPTLLGFGIAASYDALGSSIPSE